jgi:intracellular septation protein
LENPSDSLANSIQTPQRHRGPGWKALFFGGLLPVVAFTLIEDNYGTVAGIIAGLVFGLGEIIYELRTERKVSAITWIGNGLLLGLGGLSLISEDGIWFKLQPALFEIFFALALWGSLLMKKNILLLMAEKQGQVIPDILRKPMNGMSFRLGIFFIIQAALAVWAALYWSTQAWALLKGVGLTVSFVVWMAAEIFWIRFSIKKSSERIPSEP